MHRKEQIHLTSQVYFLSCNALKKEPGFVPISPAMLACLHLPSPLPLVLTTCCITQKMSSTAENHIQNRRMTNTKFPWIKINQRRKINPSLYRLGNKDL